MSKKPLTTFEIAKYCKVTHRTVQQWITSQKLKAYRTPGNHSRVEAQDFAEFLNKYKMPVPVDFIFDEGQKRILVVDDDKSMVKLIKSYLKNNKHYQIQEAFDGFMAGRKFAEFKPDLITLDIKMPFINGEDVLKEIRKNSKNNNVRIIVITGINDPDEMIKVKSMGADEYIAKPFLRPQ